MHDSIDLSVPPFMSLLWESVHVRLLLEDAMVRATVALNPLIRVMVIVEFAWDVWIVETVDGVVLIPKSGYDVDGGDDQILLSTIPNAESDSDVC